MTKYLHDPENMERVDYWANPEKIFDLSIRQLFWIILLFYKRGTVQI